MATNPLQQHGPKRVALIGAHATHLQLLQMLAARPEPGCRLTLVTAHTRVIHDQMEAGYVAGLYTRQEVEIDVRALAARVGALFVPDDIQCIDPDRKQVHFASRPPLTYDLLSLDLPTASTALHRAVGERPSPPIEIGPEDLPDLLDQPAPPAGRHIVLVGGDLYGLELALATAARLRTEPGSRITLVDRNKAPTTGCGPGADAAIQRVFAASAIEYLGGVDGDGIYGGALYLSDTRQIRADVIVWNNRSSGPPWLSISNLPLNRAGFVRVGVDLRCKGYPEVFAVGDAVSFAEPMPHVGRSVLITARARVVEANLRSAIRDSRRTKTLRLPTRSMELIGTADGRSILSYGTRVFHSKWVWRIKARFDRMLIHQLQLAARLAPSSTGTAQAADRVATGECSVDLLAKVMARAQLPRAEHIVISAQEGESAAVFAQPPDTLAAAATTVLMPFDTDLYFFGQIAATDALNALYAMGAEPTSAIVLCGLPRASDAEAEEQLEHLLSGAAEQLYGLGVAIAGGKTLAGTELQFGFSVYGWIVADAMMRRCLAAPGDRLVLTKPLGSGVIMAAARAGGAPGEWVEVAQASMLRGNGAAMRILREHGVRACTAVGRLGLAGHLLEMLKSSNVAGRLYSGHLPALPGASDLLTAKWRSAEHRGNERVSLHAYVADPGNPALPLCFDPQVSGGLLAAIPEDRIAAVRATFQQYNQPLFEIGEVREGPPQWEFTEPQGSRRT